MALCRTCRTVIPCHCHLKPPADQTALRDRIRLAIARQWLDEMGSDRTVDELDDAEFGEFADAVLAVLPEPTDRATVEADADTVATRAAQVITSMGTEIRELRAQRDRYRTAWHSARGRTARAKDARNYWHYELRNADARILELERKLRPAAGARQDGSQP